MQSPQNMQNMMQMMQNMMKSQTQPQIFDPTKFDVRTKRTWMNQTIYQSKVGLYKLFPKFKSSTFTFLNNFVPELSDNICEVFVIHEHVLDVAEQYTDKGINYDQTNGLNPVVLNVVGRDFSGSNFESCENVRDEILAIRTNFCVTLGNCTCYPMKEDECVYSKLITVIKIIIEKIN